MYYDCHVHSKFSSDSSLELDCAIQESIEKKLFGITFTDHLDLDFPGFESDYHVEPKKYFCDVYKAKEKYKNEINIFTGIEIGVQPHVIDETNKIIDSYKYDFILGSIHIVKKQDPYDKAFYQNKSKKQAYFEYLDEINNNIKLYSNFDVLGHFDYIARYSPYPDPSMLYGDYIVLLDEILKYLITNNKGLEINTSTYSKPLVQLDCQVINRYRQLGGEIITLGSDAHSENMIASNFLMYSKIIKDCGFKYIAHFEDRKPCFTII